MNSESRTVTVGRKQGNTIVLSSPDVSGEHALLTLKEAESNTWEIRDLGSRNGTFVDGQRIFQKEITPKNKVLFGNTPLPWEKLVTSGLPKQAASLSDHFDKLLPSLTTLAPAQSFPVLAGAPTLKMVYEQYIAKRSQLEELQRNEALNARYQSLGIPFTALCAGSAVFVPNEYRYISIVGSVISLLIAAWSFIKSRQFAREKRELNMTRLTEQYDIHYRCPHCHVKLMDPFPVLVQIKNCRHCKKSLIT